MPDPIFPINPQPDQPDDVLVIEPYCEDGVWFFDDPAVGLVREPFVGQVNNVLDRMTEHIPGAENGFRLRFSAEPFEGQQEAFTWVRSDPVEGDWYSSDKTGEDGWLCPALLRYYTFAPPKLYARAEPK